MTSNDESKMDTVPITVFGIFKFRSIEKGLIASFWIGLWKIMALFRCRYKLKCKVVIISTIVVIALTVSYIHSTLKETVSRDGSSGRGSYSRLFMSNDGQKEIYSDVCKIPRLPLYSSAIEHAIQPMKKPLVCNGTNLFYFENNVLTINKSVLYPEHNTLDLYEFKTKKGKNWW